MNPSHWVRLRKTAVVAGAVGTVISAVVAGANASRLAEPYWIAPRGFVADEVRTTTDKTNQLISKLESRQIQTQLYIARSQRQQIENEIASKQVLARQNEGMPREVSAAIQEQIRTLYRDLEVTRAAIENLSREAATRRP